MADDLLKDLRVLASTVSRVDEGILVFDAIADHAKSLNSKKLGEAFWYFQKAAITDLLMSFGRALGKNSKEVSFPSVSKYISRSQIVNIPVIEAYFSRRKLIFSPADALDTFCADFEKFDHPGYEKLRRLRDKLIAHQERGATWEDIGATFPDARQFVTDALDKIDTCYLAFFNVSAPVVRLSELDGRYAERTDQSIRRLIDAVLEPRDAST